MNWKCIEIRSHPDINLTKIRSWLGIKKCPKPSKSAHNQTTQWDYPMRLLNEITQGWLKIWIWQLWPKFITFFLLWILINDTNIICLSSKNMQFSKIRRLWLKNCVCHAPLKFQLQRGVADTIFEPHPPNFEKICISYRCSNDINVIFWYSQPKIHKLKKTDFFDLW